MTTPNSDGVDIHPRYQAPFDWPKFPGPEVFPFVSIKFTEGDRILPMEPRALDIFRMWRAQGYRYRFAYHWLWPATTVSIKKQADNFSRAIGLVKGFEPGEAATIDWELTKGLPCPTSDMVDEFYAIIQERHGEPAVYASDWLPDSTLDPDNLAEFYEWRDKNPNAALFYANYNIGDTPRGGWKECEAYRATLWQWTASAVVPGLGTPADMNHIFMRDVMDRLCRIQIAPPPGPKPDPTPQLTETQKMILDLPILKFGDTNDHVKRAQALLNAVRKPEHAIAEDRVFGKVTEQAVKDFQETFGLTVDGVIARMETWPALLGVYRKG